MLRRSLKCRVSHVNAHFLHRWCALSPVAGIERIAPRATSAMAPAEGGTYWGAMTLLQKDQLLRPPQLMSQVSTQAGRWRRCRKVNVRP